MKKLKTALLALPFCLGICFAALPVQERMAALTAPEACWEAFDNDKDQVVRRHAFRTLLYNDATAADAIAAGLIDREDAIRAISLYELWKREGAAAVEKLLELADDGSEEVGLTLAEIARTLPPSQERDLLIKRLVNGSYSANIRQIAKKNQGFPFFRENLAQSVDPTNDHSVTALSKFELPKDGWSFATDKEEDFHTGKNPCFAEDFDDSSWSRIAIGDIWETQGYKDYNGAAWYRLRFTPEVDPKANDWELCFGAVDEEAWVWLNGQYIGQHAKGPDGWDTPFRFDVNRELIPGQENILVVRVYDSEEAGGIWKPVFIEMMHAEH